MPVIEAATRRGWRRITAIMVLALGLVAFAANAALSLHSAAGFVEASRAVLRAHQLRHGVRQTYDDLRHVERLALSAVSHRDPGDSVRVRDWRDGTERLERDAADLETWAREEPAHAPLAGRILELARRVQTQLEDQLQLCAEQRCDDARRREALVVRLMGEAVAVVQSADAQLESALEREEASARAREESTRRLLLLSAVVGSALLLGAFALVLRQMVVSDRAARALAENEQRLETVIDTIRDGLTFSDEVGKFEIFNPAMEEICGYTAQEANAAPDFSQLIHPDPGDRSRALEGMEEVLVRGQTVGRETVIVTKDGRRKDLLVSSAIVRAQGRRWFLTTYHDVTARRQVERERERLIEQLQSALADVKTLRGLLPICGWCKKIRDDQGYYHRIEAYISAHSEAKFTHGICPDCAKKFEDDLAQSG